MKIMLSLVILFLCSCTYEMNSEGYDKILLQETETIILANTNNAVISDDGRYLFVCDSKSNQIIKYEIKTGKIIKAISPDLSLSDSICFHYRDCPNNYPILYVSLEDISKTDPELSIANHLRHQFRKVYIRNQKIFVFSLVYAPAVDKENYLNKRITNHAVLLEYDESLKLLDAKPFENTFDTHAMSFDCVEIDGEIIATCSDFVRQFQNNIYDSLIILSRYSGDGQFVDKQVYLPEVYLKSKVGYLSSQNVHLLSTGDDVCYIYPTYPYLNFLKTQKSIPMNGISDLNNVGFEKFNPEMEIDLDKYERAFPISINGLFSDGKNIYVTVLQLVFENNETFRTGILQKYDLEGNFIASIELGDYKENKIKYIGYAMQKDCFYLIKMDSQIGWTFEYVNYFNE